MGLNVLVIDDNAADRLIIGRSLSKIDKEISVYEADCTQEALEAMQNTSFDCIFLDYMLPDKDGITFLKEIYDEGADSTPFPVVMLTGYGSESVITDSIEYGAQFCLIKDNISPETLNIALVTSRKTYDLKVNLAHTQKELEERIVELEQSQKFTDLVLNTIPDFIFVKDSEYKILRANKAFMDLYPEEMQDKIIGYTTVENYDPQTVDHFLEYDQVAFEEGSSRTYEDLKLQDGRTINIDTTKV
ncbi:MAG: response regulator, partial [Alphaproteobacteria bacterium]|nr:response regulator [Alphaproteobacteria bacterium]